MEIAWFMLLLAGLFEILLALGLKYSDGFRHFWPSMGTIAATIVSFYFSSQSLRSLPIGTAYAIWTGIGAAGTALTGVVLFGDSMNVISMLCICLIVLGVVGLKFAN